MEIDASSVILQMVSPAVMLSACGLILVGLGNRFARVVDRIRSFNREWHLLKKMGESATEYDLDRLRIMEVQFPHLYLRGKLMRNSMFCLYNAIFLFVLCSFAIPIDIEIVTLITFCAGMGSVLAGTVYASREAFISFRLMSFEIPPQLMGGEESAAEKD